MTEPSTPRLFVCDKCNGVFKTDWPETAAMAEYLATFPEVSLAAPKVHLCEDCYLQLLQWLKVQKH